MDSPKPPTTRDEFMALPVWTRFIREPHPTIPGVKLVKARQLLTVPVSDHTVMGAGGPGDAYWTLAWDGTSFGRLEG